MAKSAQLWIVVLGTGACSGEGKGGGASCSGEACAGDVTGTWSFVSSCGQGSRVEDLDVDGCIQITDTLDDVRTEGRLTLAEGGAYGLDVTVTTTFTGTATVQCPEYYIDCVAAEESWTSFYGEAACSEDGIGGCSCSATLTEKVDVHGIWTADGTTVTVDDGVGETTYESCAGEEPPDALWLRTTFSERKGEFTLSYLLERAP